jgi:hypothetical protein
VEKIRVCFWTTAFQGDVLTFARHLAASREFDPVVALDDPRRFEREPVQRLLPVGCRLLDREDGGVLEEVRRFSPHVTVVDNHFPPARLSPALFVLWHGFGWRGPNDRKEFAQVYRDVRRLTGFRADRPNPFFVWQCFGPTDFVHRHRVSGFHESNLRVLGAAMSDDLVRPKIGRAQALRHYPPVFRNRKVSLLAFTWHYGRVFSHWGDDIGVLRELFEKLGREGYAVILRMHDRRRYDRKYREDLEGLARDCPYVLLKYKDEDRDNLLDLLVSDLMVSNFSSILNLFYCTGKPSIHIYPVAPGRDAHPHRVLRRGKVRIAGSERADRLWKLSPEENGGLLVKSREELMEAIALANREPDICREKSREFLRRHMAPVDGRTCERIALALRGLAEGAEPGLREP